MVKSRKPRANEMQYEIKARKGKAILMKTSIESIKRFYWYVPMA
jgi:hypothetical protein